MVGACFAHADIETVAGGGGHLEFTDANAGGSRGRAQRFDIETLSTLHRGPGHGEVAAGDAAQPLGAQPFFDFCWLARSAASAASTSA